MTQAELEGVFRAALDEFGVEVTLRTVSARPAGRDATTGQRTGTTATSESLRATRSPQRTATVNAGGTWTRVRETDYRFLTGDLTASIGRAPTEREQIVEQSELWHIASVQAECNGAVTVCTVRDAAI